MQKVNKNKIREENFILIPKSLLTSLISTIQGLKLQLIQLSKINQGISKK